MYKKALFFLVLIFMNSSLRAVENNSWLFLGVGAGATAVISLGIWLVTDPARQYHAKQHYKQDEAQRVWHAISERYHAELDWGHFDKSDIWYCAQRKFSQSQFSQYLYHKAVSGAVEQLEDQLFDLEGAERVEAGRALERLQKIGEMHVYEYQSYINNQRRSFLDQRNEENKVELEREIQLQRLENEQKAGQTLETFQREAHTLHREAVDTIKKELSHWGVYEVHRKLNEHDGRLKKLQKQGEDQEAELHKLTRMIKSMKVTLEKLWNFFSNN